MNYIKRALWSIYKRPVKTLLIFLLISVLFTFMLSALAIESAGQSADKEAREKLGSEVVLEFDYDKALMNKEKSKGVQGVSSNDVTPVTMDMAYSLTGLKHVIGYNYVNFFLFAAADFTAIPSPTETREVYADQAEAPFRNDISLEEIWDTRQLKDFINGTHEIIAGRHIAPDDKDHRYVLIEKNLAEQNGLSVGDHLTLRTREEQRLTYEIVGIYRTSKTPADLNTITISQVDMPYNKIYSSLYSLSGKAENSSDVLVGRAIYYLDDPAHISDFIQEAKTKSSIDFNIFTLNANEASYKKMMAAIDQVTGLSRTMLLFIAIAGALILVLIVLFSIRGRLTEMGVLLSLGESKAKIGAQMLVELFLLAALAFAASPLLAQAVSHKLGDELIARQSMLVQKEQEALAQGAVFMTSSEMPEIIDQLEVAVKLGDIGRLGIIAVCIIFIATALPLIVLLRLHPKDILARND